MPTFCQRCSIQLQTWVDIKKIEHFVIDYGIKGCCSFEEKLFISKKIVKKYNNFWCGLGSKFKPKIKIFIECFSVNQSSFDLLFCSLNINNNTLLLFHHLLPPTYILSWSTFTAKTLLFPLSLRYHLLNY